VVESLVAELMNLVVVGNLASAELNWAEVEILVAAMMN